jgi:hypothetical protein
MKNDFFSFVHSFENLEKRRWKKPKQKIGVKIGALLLGLYCLKKKEGTLFISICPKVFRVLKKRNFRNTKILKKSFFRVSSFLVFEK